jgi:sucrose synthase
MVFNVVILSPHGYFAQANVLGYPDTGGQVESPTQFWHLLILSPYHILNSTKSLLSPTFVCVGNAQVVYILDQVRAMENEMLLRIKQQGLDITPKILIVSSVPNMVKYEVAI